MNLALFRQARTFLDQARKRLSSELPPGVTTAVGAMPSPGVDALASDAAFALAHLDAVLDETERVLHRTTELEDVVRTLLDEPTDEDRARARAALERSAYPKRRYDLRMRVGGDDWPTALATFRDFVALVERQRDDPARIERTAGSDAAGGWVFVTVSPRMTHDRYIEELG